ncbi:MAG TPA: nuclear transport factor 2 family protein [Candidatus Elarobacter sp.]|jgi:ketosteroid isomerase-like protein|nr:nuclear transport factor 2 family protein [Candidatus Elarobacter sp.]
MVREDTVAAVQAAFDDFRRGDIGSLLARLTDDIDWETPGAGTVIPYAGRLHGKPAIAKFFESVGSTTEFRRFDTNEFAANGDLVVALGEWDGVVRATGVATAEQFAMAFWFRGDKVCKFREFSDTRSLIAALSAPPIDGGR